MQTLRGIILINSNNTYYDEMANNFFRISKWAGSNTKSEIVTVSNPYECKKL